MKPKTYFTNQRCPKCGGMLRTSDLPEYSFVCPECDENFYGVEVTKGRPATYTIKSCCQSVKSFLDESEGAVVLSASIVEDITSTEFRKTPAYRNLTQEAVKMQAVSGVDLTFGRVYIKFTHMPTAAQIQKAAELFGQWKTRSYLECEGVIFDCYDETDTIFWSEICQVELENYYSMRKYVSDGGAVGSCGVWGCFTIGADTDEGTSYIDFPKENCTEFQLSDSGSSVKMAEFLTVNSINSVLPFSDFSIHKFNFRDGYVLNVSMLNGFHVSIESQKSGEILIELETASDNETHVYAAVKDIIDWFI